MTVSKHMIRWLVVILVPLSIIAYIYLVPAANSLDHLINGIILACAATFLFKFVLFAAIGHHLRGEHTQKKQTYFLFIPIILLILYTVYYFQVV